jgi:tetratricopeptide (TPR) repeat protein
MKNVFEIEIDTLLREYLGDEDFNRFNQNLNYTNNAADEISVKINDFYRDQLQLNICNYNERIKIDRTITFSEKKLETDKFCKFLLELGRICLSGGKLNFATEIFKKTFACSPNSTEIFKAESLIGLADVYSRRANWSKSLRLVGEAESLYKKLNDKIGLAKCENLLGSIYGEMGEVEKAKQHFLNSLSLINPEVDLEIAANLESNLGALDNMQGNFVDSLIHLAKALIIFQELGNYKRISEVNLNIGMVHHDSEEYELAIAAFDAGIKIAKECNFISILCMLYLAKSRALISINDIFNAAQFADKAFEISHDIDDKLTLADIYKIKGIIERHLKNFRAAESYLLDSLRINTFLRNAMNIAETSFELGMLYEELKNYESKHFYLKSSLNYYKEINASAKAKEIDEILQIKAA